MSLLSGWERERRIVVTLDDIRRLVGRGAPDIAQDLVRKNALQRLRPGTYLVRPFRTLTRATLPSTPLAVEAMLLNEPHYLGGLWALSLHGLTEQRYASVFDVFVTHRLAPRQLGAGYVRFHLLESKAFGYGITTSAIEGMNVHLSDAERTLLDAFDRPRIFGGLGRALELAKAHLPRLDRARLVIYALAGSKPSTLQRIGALLEREGMSPRALAKLRARTRGTRSLLSMNPDAPRTGRVNARWNVVENDL